MIDVSHTTAPCPVRADIEEAHILAKTRRSRAAIQGTHDTGGVLPETAVEMIHRVTTYLSPQKQVRTSRRYDSGCSNAAKWPPLSSSLKYTTFAKRFSAKRLEV